MKNLYKRISHEQSLLAAWHKIRKKPFSSGFDNQSITDFKDNLEQEITNLSQELKTGKFVFSSLKGVPLAKPGKSLRPIKVLSVRDRVIQKTIELEVSPYLSKAFDLNNEASFAYIAGKSTRKALNQVQIYYDQGNNWVYKGDIQKFFDSVDRNKLLERYIFPNLPDESLNSLIIKSMNLELGNQVELENRGIDVSNIFPDLETGLPQGAILSPLFSNIFLNDFDKKMLESGFNLVRYADDFIVMCRDKGTAIVADKLARRIIEIDLGLTLYPVSFGGAGKDKKSTISRLKNIEFLGISISGDHLYPASAAFKNMISLLRSLPRKEKGLVWNLSYIQGRVDSWGSTYHFTELITRYYQVLNSNLHQCLIRTLKLYGLKFKNRNITKQTLKQIGMKNFDQSVLHHKNRLSKKRKK